MYQASPFRQTIPSKSTILPTDHQLDYTDSDIIRFEVPKFVGMIDPRQSYLSMKVQINDAPCRTRFNSDVGCQGIINNLRIWDLESSCQMDNLEDDYLKASKTLPMT